MILLLAPAASGRAAPGRIDLQAAVLYETNIQEALAEAEESDGTFLRLLGSTESPPWRPHERLELDARLRAGLDLYGRLDDESRWLADLELNGVWNWRRGRRFSLQTSLYHQAYPNDDRRDFQRRRLEAGFRRTFPSRWALSAHVDLHQVRYFETEAADEGGWGVRLGVAKPLGRGWMGEGFFRLGGDAFNHPSLEATEVNGEVTYDLGPDRRDAMRTVGLALGRLRPFVLRCGYAYSARHSNSFGFSQRQHELTALISMALPFDIDLQALGNLQSTNYTDPGIDTVFVYVPGEVEARENDNSISLRLRRPLGRGPVFELRSAWFRNESLLVGRFYDKWIVGCAVRWGGRFEPF
ncbi:MAG: hypothetical protein GF355_12035 [Candidatus Eisenbacteria bacterium]|nr:hypothetical protein [Candidatus Eisenbacteria bacterium]